MSRDREAQARRDLSRTAVTRRVALALTGTALCVLLIPAPVQWARGDVHDAIAEARSRAHPWRAFRTDGAVAAALESETLLRAGSDALEERSPVRRAFLSTWQSLETLAFGDGNRKVIVARDGWLYLRSDLEHLAGEPPAFRRSRTSGPSAAAASAVARNRSSADALATLEELASRLEQRGVPLWVLLLPGKARIETAPLGLAPEPTDERSIAVRGETFAPLVAALLAKNPRARLLDAGPWMAQEHARRGAPLFLRSDTHWNPHGVEVVATRLAEEIGREIRLPTGARPLPRERSPATITHQGDLARALGLPARLMSRLGADESVVISRLPAAAAEASVAPTGAPVLLLGDSFSNIYSDPVLGWGEGGGLAETLSAYLGHPVDRLAITGGGPRAAIDTLRDHSMLDDRMANTRVVIVQVVEYELTSGDWNAPKR